MKLVIGFYAVFCFSLLNSPKIFSQSIDFEEYVITQYGMQEGLPQSTINDIIQTRDGYIWLATYGGLVRFDGVSFTTYDRSNTPGMRSDRILHLLEDNKGVIWMGTEDGFLKFKDGVCTLYGIELDSFIYSPSMIKEDAHGTIWMVGIGKAFKVEGDSVVQAEVVQDSVLAQKAMQDENGVWLAHERQILRTTGDKVIQVADLSDRTEHNIIDFVEMPANSGEYFLGTTGDGVFHYKDGELKLYNAQDGLKSRYTWNFYVDSMERLWVTSFRGISMWNGDGFTPLDLTESSKGVQLNRVLEDNDGNYWIGSLGDGLFKLRPSQIQAIGLDDGLKNDQMLSLAALNDSSYVFATNCGGVYEYNPKTQELSQPPISEMLPNQCIWSVFKDSKERIWFGSKLLYQSNSLEEPGITIDEDDGFNGVDIFTISEDSKGNIWIGDISGLYKYDGETYFRYSTENGLSYNDTRTVFEDQDGVIWAGTSNGLNRIENGNASPVVLLRDRERQKNESEPYVRAIHQEENGTMWIGTYGHGLFRIKDGEIVPIQTQHGLYDNIVSHIIEDEFGNFWMGSNRGIYRVSKKQLNDFADNKISEISGFVYGVNDGMLSAETNGGFEPNVIQSHDGKLYFPTVSGVAVVSTEKEEVERQPPIVYIENIKNGDADLSGAKSIKLNYDNAFLEIKYTALSFRDPDKVKFRYKLEGLNENWFEVGANRNALFTKIPPGEYIFKVTSSSNNGPWNPQSASLGITVVPPYWETPWFYTLVFILLFSIGPSVYFLRTRQLRRDNERKRRFAEQLIDSQEQERRRIASELHDGLGQQILVIKNRAELAIQTITNPDEATWQLKEILESAKISIGDVRSISHGLRPIHLEKFGLTESIENMCMQIQRTSKTEWSYYISDIDGLIPENKEINLYRVIQEATNNIQKHAEAKEASVVVMNADKFVKVNIWDDGKGFNINDESLEGLGFTGMMERVETLGGSIGVRSKPGEGTVIKIAIPVSE